MTHAELNLCPGFMSEKLPDVLSKERGRGETSPSTSETARAL